MDLLYENFAICVVIYGILSFLHKNVTTQSSHILLTEFYPSFQLLILQFAGVVFIFLCYSYIMKCSQKYLPQNNIGYSFLNLWKSMIFYLKSRVSLPSRVFL